MSKVLTDKQEDFCYYFIKLRNASAAAKEAGYSARTANRIGHILLTNPDINNRMVALRKELRIATIADVKERMEAATVIVREELKTPVTGREQVMAIAELNKMDGSYAPDKQLILGDIKIEVTYVNRDRDKANGTDTTTGSTLPPG